MLTKTETTTRIRAGLAVRVGFSFAGAAYAEVPASGS